MIRSLEEVRNTRNLYSGLGLNYLGISPLDKQAYRGVSAWTVYRQGGNIAGQFDNLKHVYGDVDSLRIPKLTRRILLSTLSWRSPKGYGFVLRDADEADPRFLAAFRALRYSDLIVDKNSKKWLWDSIDEKDLSFGLQIRKHLTVLGITDPIGIHGLFKDLDGLTYSLLPNSTSCRNQGRNGQPVREHTSHIDYCNNSPDHKHSWFTRRFVNYVSRYSDLLTFQEFMEIALQ
jgi:hypothetical protein